MKHWKFQMLQEEDPTLPYFGRTSAARAEWDDEDLDLVGAPPTDEPMPVPPSQASDRVEPDDRASSGSANS